MQEKLLLSLYIWATICFFFHLMPEIDNQTFSNLIILIGSENPGISIWNSPRKIGLTLTIEAGFVRHEIIQVNQ